MDINQQLHYKRMDVFIMEQFNMNYYMFLVCFSFYFILNKSIFKKDFITNKVDQIVMNI